MEEILKYALLVLQYAPAIVAAGLDLKGYIDRHLAIINAWGVDSVPTDEQWAALNAEIAALRDKLHSDDV